MVFEKIEHGLDEGHGSCVLQEERFAVGVHQSMQHFLGERYELGASVVMPNHIHCILRPLRPNDCDVEAIVGSWKSFTARRINSVLKQTGELWQAESYDRIIRDEEHLWRCIQYICRNPKKAGLCAKACKLWINPDWAQLGWIFTST